MPKSSAGILASFCAGLFAVAAVAEDVQLQCVVGPVEMTYGNALWRAHSCSDGQSVILVSAPGNPANPYYFLLRPANAGVTVAGQGSGDKGASDAALAELQKLSGADLAAIVRDTRAQAAAPPDTN